MRQFCFMRSDSMGESVRRLVDDLAIRHGLMLVSETKQEVRRTPLGVIDEVKALLIDELRLSPKQLPIDLEALAVPEHSSMTIWSYVTRYGGGAPDVGLTLELSKENDIPVVSSDIIKLGRLILIGGSIAVECHAARSRVFDDLVEEVDMFINKRSIEVIN
jgi:hypothetical protein